MKVLLSVLCVLALGTAAQAENKMAAKPAAAPAAKAAAAAPAPTTKSLYERLGGAAAIKAVVHDFVGRAAGDAKVNFLRDGKFKNIDVTKLEGHLTQFIGMATGGPEKYDGRDMKTAHTGMKIKGAEFDALAADLSASLDKFKVPAQEKGELMAIAASTKPAIVEVK